jgi:hypothetical protein
MGLPVYFVTAGYDRTKHSMDRFDGLLELLHIVDGEAFGYTSRKPWGKLLQLLRLHKTQNNSLKHLLPEKHVQAQHDKSTALAHHIETTISE